MIRVRRLAVDPAVALGYEDRFEARVRSEGAQERADVITDGVWRKPKVSCDVGGRSAVSESSRNVVLPRREHRRAFECAKGSVALRRRRLHDAEDADNLIGRTQGNC